MDSLNIALIGYKFMGRAHSSAWIKAPLFFESGLKPRLKVVCGRHEQAVEAFARRWGWEEHTTDWRTVIDRADVDAVDISVPQHLHFEIAMAALQAGKHVFCEKPLALSVDESAALAREAKRHPGLVCYLNHNYRRVPAVQLAKQLIDRGEIGRIFHWRGAYLQDWLVSPDFPLDWHLQEETAGSGPQGDLGSHSVDLARFLVGEISRVSCMTASFITERPAAGTEGGLGKVTVEDAAFMNVRFAEGALGSIDTSRFALGRRNANTFEIYGSRGSLMFDLEKMNELQFYRGDDPPGLQGFRTIQATEAEHAYISSWWPAGHIIGYEHTFVHAAADFIDAVAHHHQIKPDFTDGLREQEVLEAGLQSAREGREVEVPCRAV